MWRSSVTSRGIGSYGSGASRRSLRNGDFRKLSPDLQGQFKDIVLKGAAAPLGMESFNDILSEADVEAIQAYVIDQAWQGYNEQEKSKAK